MESNWQSSQWGMCDPFQQTIMCNYLAEHLIRVNAEVSRLVYELTVLRKDFYDVQRQNEQLNAEIVSMQKARQKVMVQNEFTHVDNMQSTIVSHHNEVICSSVIDNTDPQAGILQTVKTMDQIKRKENKIGALMYRCATLSERGWDQNNFVTKQQKRKKRRIPKSQQRWMIAIRVWWYGFVTVIPKRLVFGDGRFTGGTTMRDDTRATEEDELAAAPSATDGGQDGRLLDFKNEQF